MGVQTPKVRKCKHFLSLDRVSISDSKKTKTKKPPKNSEAGSADSPSHIPTPPFPGLLSQSLSQPGSRSRSSSSPLAPLSTFRLRSLFVPRTRDFPPHPLPPRKNHWQTPILSRKVLKSNARSPMQHKLPPLPLPPLPCPACIPGLFSSSGFGEREERERERERRERVWRGRRREGKEYGKIKPAAGLRWPPLRARVPGGCGCRCPGARCQGASASPPPRRGRSSPRAPTPAAEPTCCSPVHCVRRDLLWPPLLPGSSILVGIHLSARATHTLHTHGDCERAASIVAPLRQTQTDIFFFFLQPSSSNLPPVQQLQRGRGRGERERERERERASERREKLIRN
ncbi:uncharacterized protein LOC123652227 [Pipistrellus kuhlii]|uniref:uncharacterized protein LOC123652227 n=1 Tax=Pipistrellus kuhlii TaxID=59472 RepID=UPI001E272CD9|nr:uncharacterized protein LOC123652227 [Pipistrellus kuhlii]